MEYNFGYIALTIWWNCIWWRDQNEHDQRSKSERLGNCYVKTLSCPHHFQHSDLCSHYDLHSDTLHRIILFNQMQIHSHKSCKSSLALTNRHIMAHHHQVILVHFLPMSHVCFVHTKLSSGFGFICLPNTNPFKARPTKNYIKSPEKNSLYKTFLAQKVLQVNVTAMSIVEKTGNAEKPCRSAVTPFAFNDL